MYLETSENGNAMIYEMQQNSFKEEVYTNTNLPQEARKVSNKQFNCIAKGTRKRSLNKPKISRSEETIKIRAEIETEKNHTHTEREREKINASKNWFLEKKKSDRPLARLIKKKKRAQIKPEMKEEKSQPTPQKYKGS